MNEHARQIIKSTFDASNDGTIHFGQAIQNLMSVQVESYHVDYRSERTTFALANDATLDLDLGPVAVKIAPALNIEALRAAILAAQQGRVMYPEFKKLSQQAGCVGYSVWIAGRHVTYLGRCGETHVEHFPK